MVSHAASLLSTNKCSVTVCKLHMYGDMMCMCVYCICMHGLVPANCSTTFLTADAAPNCMSDNLRLTLLHPHLGLDLTMPCTTVILDDLSLPRVLAVLLTQQSQILTT